MTTLEKLYERSRLELIQCVLRCLEDGSKIKFHLEHSLLVTRGRFTFITSTGFLLMAESIPATVSVIKTEITKNIFDRYENQL